MNNSTSPPFFGIPLDTAATPAEVTFTIKSGETAATLPLQRGPGPRQSLTEKEWIRKKKALKQTKKSRRQNR